ncbi:Detected protein of unknown function [Hibiscus syriacus]|uniref:Exostosin GT47 domain-containing protein n=1 Tax=Hibiscus syriacus TaxID=106335 RepID=A0A6A3B6U1_HIBSY|nr:Detected protein of unknown function [Hibiscus syriacus]
MEKPMTGKCPCRSQSWGDSFLDNNRTGFIGSSESLHDKAIDERKPIKFYIDRDIDIDRLIASLMSDNNETETFETITGKLLEEELRNAKNDNRGRRERARPRRIRRRNRIKPAAAAAAAAAALAKIIGQKINKVVPEPKKHNVVKSEPLPSSCSGRYIFIHDIPRKFNQDLLDNCKSLSFLLEVIFHNRMKQYKCLTNDPSLASAIYVPYYAGLDVGHYLWDRIGFRRDHDAAELVKWLAGRPEWEKMSGRDHFLVAGRISWDFRRDPKNVSDWGNGFLNFPESKNMTMLVIESSPWKNNDFAIPHPTYFHPLKYDDVFQWQNKMRRLKRPLLFSFAGARRPNRDKSIHNEIINQCLASRKKCRFLECDDQSQRFSICSIYMAFPQGLYAILGVDTIQCNLASKLETIEDAFDLTVKGVVDRVEMIRKQKKDGKEVNSEFPEQESWKYFTFVKLGGHEWDHFFSKKLGKHGT